MQVMFHEAKSLVLTKGSETKAMNFERGALYQLEKHRKDEDSGKDIFYFKYDDVNWKLEYVGNDFELFHLAGEDQVKEPSLDSDIKPLEEPAKIDTKQVAQVLSKKMVEGAYKKKFYKR